MSEELKKIIKNKLLKITIKNIFLDDIIVCFIAKEDIKLEEIMNGFRFKALKIPCHFILEKFNKNRAFLKINSTFIISEFENIIVEQPTINDMLLLSNELKKTKFRYNIRKRKIIETNF